MDEQIVRAGMAVGSLIPNYCLFHSLEDRRRPLRVVCGDEQARFLIVGVADHQDVVTA